MQESSMELLWGSSHISGGNAAYVEELYEVYLQDPNDVPEEWRTYFEKLPQVNGSGHQDVPHSPRAQGPFGGGRDQGCMSLASPRGEARL